MRWLCRFYPLALLGAGALLFAVGEARATPRTYPLTGTVRAILSPSELVIAHEEIPGFMPAMTMAFPTAEPLPNGAVAVGDTIRAVLLVDEGDMHLEQLVRVGAGAPAAARAHPRQVPRLDEGDPVPDFALRDQQGEPFSLVSENHYTVLTFIFTRCPLPDFCPLMTSRFEALQGAIQDGEAAAPLHLVSLTIDPEFDQPEILRAYGEAFGADPKLWTLACASTAETDRVVRAFRVFRERQGALLDHTLCTALIRPDGTVAQFWRGNDWAIADILTALARDARTLRAGD